MVAVLYIAEARFGPAASVASVLGACAATSTTTALQPAASRRTASWPICSSVTAVGTSRFTATAQKRSYKLWLSAPGHQDTDRDLTIQGGCPRHV
jgi:hypothetical protein